jgi:hypothetical protein
MRNLTRFIGMGIACAVLAAPSFSQTELQTKPVAVASKAAETARYFRLDFTVKELENGKVVNTRAFSTTMQSATNSYGASIRAGDKVPVSSGDSKITYLDVGVNIDCRDLKVVDNQLALQISADISNPVESAGAQPIIRQYRWAGIAFVPLRKPVTVFVSDAVSNKRQMQLELTATPLP